jgi:hypothetical protein
MNINFFCLILSNNIKFQNHISVNICQKFQFFNWSYGNVKATKLIKNSAIFQPTLRKSCPNQIRHLIFSASQLFTRPLLSSAAELSAGWQHCSVEGGALLKKVNDFPVPIRDITKQALPAQEYFNNFRPGRVW